jgi:alkanesulfonate monooxygenase
VRVVIPAAGVDIFSTCPQSKDVPAAQYVQRVIDVSRWSEEFGCRGILVYTDNSIVDPWLLAQIILQHTRTLEPLVAVQPVYMHPYFVAKKVATLALLHGRRVALNMLAGGFKNDLAALGDDTPHDDRYRRLVEYTVIVRKLLESADPVTVAGRYFSVKNLRMSPPLPRELFPLILSSGSSEAGVWASREMEAVAVRYPAPAGEEETLQRQLTRWGVRVGVVARETADAAWAAAESRFPEDRKGELTHQLAMKVSDSEWHRQLSRRDDAGESRRSPYWLGPFQRHQTFCPYLVGAYDTVTELIAEYLQAGCQTFVLDIPPDRDDLEHTGLVFSRAIERAQIASL